MEQSCGRDVSVFWACGVTASRPSSAANPLAFSHSPGCMFLTDIPDCSPPPAPPPPSDGARRPSTGPDGELTPLCFLISHNPLWYSLASKSAVTRIRQLEAIIGEDPGQTRMCRCREVLLTQIQVQLLRDRTSHLTRLMAHLDHRHGNHAAVAREAGDNGDGQESRGHDTAPSWMKLCAEAAIPLVTFEDSGPDSALRFLCHHGDPSKPRYDHLVAIERSGRAADGNYYNMRGVNIKHLVDPVDDLFTAAQEIPGITTTGIGDGGNELGMGKLKEKVEALMPNGSLIACDVSADYAVTAGVSNWGGYAVACGLHLLHTCSSHQRYLKKGLGHTTLQEQIQDWTANLPSVDKEEAVLSTLVSFGIRSGKTGHLAMEVDGLTFHPTHSDIITRLLEVTLGSTNHRPG
ncbi:D-glutamate cyclase, mitochondrial [Larimichthys crocea]|uniref:D-glutamate cyclase, mitochondrial n=1 Tax=Larimichthys crocea TaxID=215358 RepID=A0A6G0IGC0_LARCR|nr:D-glutamate cyclase, mitochondrial [Larimichthys crocea]